MDLNHARLPIPPRWQSELQSSGGRVAAVSEGLTCLFLQPVSSLSNHRCTNRKQEAGSLPIPASPSSKFSHLTPSKPDSPFPPLPHISETRPRRLPEPCLPPRSRPMCSPTPNPAFSSS